MQLLHRIETDGFEAWKSEFDSEAEKRMQAGLTLFQMWRDADDENIVLCLYEVNDRDRADVWLKNEASLGARATARFLRTA